MIGDNIRRLRENSQLSREEVAAKVGIGLDAIEHYESNTWRPGLEVTVKLAKLFQATVVDIMDDCQLHLDPITRDTLIVQSDGRHVRVIGVLVNEGNEVKPDPRHVM
ncbi:MAG: helix-turn-helix transcriptional regulator [Bacillota bacterium]|nr:helix-turn-helix transcriptional regulator [Bacillota bacterium]